MEMYRVLGIQVGASKEEVRAAYKRRALALHPDKGGCKEAFHAVAHAFETLYDDSARKRAAAADVTNPPPDSASAPSRPKDKPPARTCQAGQHSSTRQGADSGKVRKNTSHPHWPGPSTANRADKRSGQPGASEGPDASWEATEDGCLGNICHRLSVLLRSLSPAERRHVLQSQFSQSQRRTLEEWMKARQDRSCTTAQCTSTSTPVGDAVVAVVNDDPSNTRKRRGGARSSSSTSNSGSDSDDDGRAIKVALMDWYPPSDLHDNTSHRLHDIFSTAEQEGVDLRTEAEAPWTRGPSDGRPKPRCVTRYTLKGITYYRAAICVDGLHLRTRCFKELSSILDIHVALMSIRQRMPAAHERETLIKPIIDEILQGYGLDAESDMGLRMYVSFWCIHLLGRELCTPSLPFSRIGDVMRVWARGQALNPLAKLRRRVFNMFDVYAPPALSAMWSELKEMYLKSWGAEGIDVGGLGEELDAEYAARRAHRERQLELWNAKRMRSEDRTMLALAVAQRRERRAMSQERRLSANFRRLLKQLHSCLRRWRKLDTDGALAAARRRRRDELLERSAQRARRESRWRWMNRPDITVEEMMRGPPQLDAEGTRRGP
eukprot:TRINITY_DN5833_c0_g1_i2.p1 TRINITY_DN5833_c0_g1~~TRINITY_DN5833_c0_g1_i2.p1  ORF type:complete len:605 (-),score=76.93 TRINITY_DN5833_c0_g1_i2:242-2056(-)